MQGGREGGLEGDSGLGTKQDGDQYVMRGPDGRERVVHEGRESVLNLGPAW